MHHPRQPSGGRLPCCQQDLFKRRSSAAAGETPISSFFIKSFPHNRPVQDGKKLGGVSVVCQKKMARDESAIRLRGTGSHWAETPRRRMKSSAETPSYPYPVWPPKLYANVQLLQSKFCVQRVDERERRFAVSAGCCEQGRADRERRFAVSLTEIELLQPKNLPPEGFSGLRRDGSFLETFSLAKGFPKLICAAN